MNETIVDQTSQSEKPATPRGLARLFLILVLFIPAGLVLGWLDNTTQISPDTGNLIVASFVAAAIGGLLSAGIAIYLSKCMSVVTRVRWALPLLMIGAIGPYMVINHAAMIVSGWVNFPPSGTTSRTALMLIDRAYHTHGKGAAAHIQTMQVWTDLTITEVDYRFMLQHRRPGDASQNPDSISSKGYLCARVVLQQSGIAARIMHAGNGDLPEGSIVTCPAGGAAAAMVYSGQ
jgi:hypothetical protein